MWTEFFINGRGSNHFEKHISVRTWTRSWSQWEDKDDSCCLLLFHQICPFSVIMINKVTFDLDSHSDVCPEPTLYECQWTPTGHSHSEGTFVQLKLLNDCVLSHGCIVIVFFYNVMFITVDRDTVFVSCPGATDVNHLIADSEAMHAPCQIKQHYLFCSLW